MRQTHAYSSSMNRALSIESRDRPGAPRYAHAVEALCAAIPGLQAVYLFGSQTRGRIHSESDVDLAILLPKPLAPEARWDLQEEVASLIHADVDLIDLAATSTVMQMQVVTTGLVLFEKAPFVRQSFEMRVLSAYALLNEERAALLDHVHQRGRVYGR